MTEQEKQFIANIFKEGYHAGYSDDSLEKAFNIWLSKNEDYLIKQLKELL